MLSRAASAFGMEGARKRIPALLLAGCALCAVGPAGAFGEEEAPVLRWGGALGFGVSVRKQAGRFDWDWDSAREETTLAEVKLEARPAMGVAVFLRFGARLDAFRNEDAPQFELSEASLRLGRWVGADSLGLRLFAGQPASLWLDHGLGAPLDPTWIGDDVRGVRAGLADPRGILVLMAADRNGWIGTDRESGPNDQLFLVRFRGDATGAAGLRIGGTYMRQVPFGGLVPGALGVQHRDYLGVDLRLLVASVQAQVEYSVVSTAFDGGAVFAETAEPGLRTRWDAGGSRLTDVMPTNGAFRAELRAPRLGSSRWGWLGLAPAYRAIGANHTNPAGPGRLGSPLRGVEGARLEVWYEVPLWPLWLRHAYDREVQFRDAARRVIRQESEIEARLSHDLRARLRYIQSQGRNERTREDEFADDWLTELWATQGAARFRVQWAALGVNGAQRRDAFAVESGLRMSSRVQLLGRATWTREVRGLRRAFFMELQYWHLPVFEAALQVGPDWIGDAADPVLDPDVAVAADQRDFVRLHFRGWF